MIRTLSIPIADSSRTPAHSSGRGRLHGAGSALGRAAAGSVFVATLAVTSTFLGPAGLALTCGLATLVIGFRFLDTARRRRDP